MSPTASGGSAATPNNDDPNYTPNLPEGQLELATLGLSAAKFWLTSKLGDLLWKEKAAFLPQAQAYFDSITSADAATDDRSPAANRLRELDKLIDKALSFVKGYLAEDHEGDADEAFYDAFGIVAEGKNQRLPKARPARAKALVKLLAAVEAHGYNGRKFGKAYWTPLEAEYKALVAQRRKTEGTASGEVGKKNVQEKPLRQVLRSLINLIKANYPDTYKSVLREFGFQKEGY